MNHARGGWIPTPEEIPEDKPCFFAPPSAPGRWFSQAVDHLTSPWNGTSACLAQTLYEPSKHPPPDIRAGGSVIGTKFWAPGVIRSQVQVR